MIVVPRSQQQVQPRAIQGTSDELRRMDLSDAFGAVGAELMVQSGDVMEKMARREDELLRKETELQMLTDLSAFDVENERRVQEITQQSPGRGLTQRVMEDFNERKQSIVDMQPNYLKGEAQTRLLPLQVRQAKSAIGAENAQIKAANELRARTFQDSLTNSVAFGRVSIDDAANNIETYISKLPAISQESTRLNLTNSVYSAHILNQMQQDPATTVQDIKNGVYDDKVDPRSLLSLYGQGQKVLAKSAGEANKLRDQAEKLRAKDPAQSAITLLRANGVAEPTAEDILNVQTLPREQGGLGLPKAYETTKGQAEEFMLQLKGRRSAEDAVEYLQEVKAQMLAKGADPANRFQEIAELSDAPPQIKMGLTMDLDNVDPAFQTAWFSIVQNGEDTVRDASNIIRANLTEADQQKALAPAQEHRLKIQSALERAGVSPTDSLSQSQAFYNTSVVAAASLLSQESADRGKMASRLTDIINSYSIQDLRVEDNDAYVLPKIVSSSIPHKVLRDARRSVIDERLYEFIPDFIDEELQEADYRQGVSWAMRGNDALGLVFRSQPITYRGTNLPIELPFTDLYEIVSENNGQVTSDMILERIRLRQRATPIPLENRQ